MNAFPLMFQRSDAFKNKKKSLGPFGADVFSNKYRHLYFTI